MRKLILTVLLIVSSFYLGAQTSEKNVSISKEQVIAQMNYCINSITNVIHYKSMSLLEHEIDQLLNNLTMEQVVGLYEIQSFRSELIEKISDLKITEEERDLMRRVQEMKRENMLYSSISNSLSPTLLLTGGKNGAKQLAFMAIITAARAAVEYKAASNDADIEELQAMWAYRKADLQNFAKLRKDALELVYKLFQKYELNEKDRLTEATSILFAHIIAEGDPDARIRKLLDNQSTFENIADFYYYLGMAYIDIERYQEGKQYLDKYISMYQKAPIFRYDEKTGCIALTKMAFEKELSNDEIIRLIDIATDNLPNNGSAIIQSVLVLNDIGQKERAFNLLRSGIDNDMLSDKDALVTLATKLLDEIKLHPIIFKQIYAAVNHCKGIKLNSYIPFVINANQPDCWEKISRCIQINKKGKIIVDAKYRVDLSSLIVQKEQHDKNLVVIDPCELNYSNAIKARKIKRKFKSLKSDPKKIYIFFDPISGNDLFKVKSNLDYERITKGEYPGMSTIPSREAAKIAKYCRKAYEATSGQNIFKLKKDKSASKTSTLFRYADYLSSRGFVSTIDYTNYTADTSIANNEECTIKTRKNVFKIYPPLREYCKNVIRIILPGTDTTQVCFSKAEEYSLYSYSFNSKEFFYEPHNITSVKDEPSEEKSEGWFKRLLRKRMKIGKKISKSIYPDSLNDEIEEIYSSYTVIGGVFHLLFNPLKPNAPQEDTLENTQENSNTIDLAQLDKDDSSNKNWFRRLWDSIWM